MVLIASVGIVLGVRHAVLPAGFRLRVVNLGRDPISDIRISLHDKTVMVGHLPPSAVRNFYVPSSRAKGTGKVDLAIDYAEPDGRLRRGRFGVEFTPNRFEPHIQVGFREINNGRDAFVGGLEDYPLRPMIRLARRFVFGL